MKTKRRLQEYDTQMLRRIKKLITKSFGRSAHGQVCSNGCLQRLNLTAFEESKKDQACYSVFQTC